MTDVENVRLQLYAGILAEHAERSQGVTCSNCGGEGYFHMRVDGIDYGREDCGNCKGTGKVTKPPDDSPRLVYADWLEENGEPERAEFIRVQVEYSRLVKFPGGPCGGPCAHENGPAVCGCRRCALRRRERALRITLWETLVACCPVPPWQVGDLDARPEHQEGFSWLARCRRGFVAAITLTAEDWLGGECSQCQGTGHFPGTLPVCHRCLGTGRLSGCADALLWSPEQPCRACNGRGFWNDETDMDYPCRDCRGTRRRPMPPSACPIEEVALTSLPPLSWLRGRVQPYTRKSAAWALCNEWPRITFHLPGDKP